MDMPDIDDSNLDILEWDMQPGDAVLFDFRTVHDARGNFQGIGRRAFSMRWVGDRLVLRLRAEPSDDEVAALQTEFGSLWTDDGISRSGPLDSEVAEEFNAG